MRRRRRHEVQFQMLVRRVDALEAASAGHAPVSEVERLNLAFDELALRAPLSEVERVNLAFERISTCAPLGRVEELEGLVRGVHGLVQSEVERLNRAFTELAELRRSLADAASERSVEIPWVLAQYRGESRVLEVGYANAEDRYIHALEALDLPFLVGLDLACDATDRSSAFARVQGDVRAAVFAQESFDLILMISTIEHIGRDNSIYGLDGDRPGNRPDIDAIGRLAGWLAPQGRLLLSVPFGRFEDHGWLINYDAAHLESLIDASGLEVVSKIFYEYRGGWVRCDSDAVRHRGYQSLGAPHAGAVALVELVKPAGQQAHSSSLAGGES